MISKDARLTGRTVIHGNSIIEPGAVIINSILENVHVQSRAVIRDSVIIGSQDSLPEKEKHSIQSTSKWDIREGSPSIISSGAHIKNSTLLTTSIGPNTLCSDSSVLYSRIGPDNTIKHAYLNAVNTLEKVTVQGPTEISGAWLGHHCRIDECGYFEGVFSNDFYILEFNKQKGTLIIKETLDIPHTSRYGMNVINSANSGRIREQTEGILTGIGTHKELWHDEILSHEPIILGPMCWVNSWTKIIGKSPLKHKTTDALIADERTTYLSPFSVSGLNSNSVTGQILPGEQNNGNIYHQREPAWIYTYSPDAVIGMVQKTGKLSGDWQTADNLAYLALKNAITLIEFYAYQRKINLEKSPVSRGWGEWLSKSRKILSMHLDSGLWNFSNGEPVQWKKHNGSWKPKNKSLLLSIAPDAIKNRMKESEFIKCRMSKLKQKNGISTSEYNSIKLKNYISPKATVSPEAIIGKGVIILGNSTVEKAAKLDGVCIKNSMIGSGAKIINCLIKNSTVQEKTELISTFCKKSTIGNNSRIISGRIIDSSLAPNSTVYPFGRIDRSSFKFPSIIGSSVKNSHAETFLMTYHMPGTVSHLEAIPSQGFYKGQNFQLNGIPMLGGGIRVLGKKNKKVITETAFIGSNTILEPGAYISFGCFILGTLSGDSGLLPFTVAIQSDPKKDQIGMVLFQMAHVIITHFVAWTFHANNKNKADLISQLIFSKIHEGIEAIAWIQSLRKEKKAWDKNSPFSKYKSLKFYSGQQLQTGLEAYKKAIEDNRWQISLQKDELKFTGDGNWNVSNGSAKWKSHNVIKNSNLTQL